MERPFVASAKKSLISTMFSPKYETLRLIPVYIRICDTSQKKIDDASQPDPGEDDGDPEKQARQIRKPGEHEVGSGRNADCLYRRIDDAERFHGYSVVAIIAPVQGSAECVFRGCSS